jgi:hypothetical protein
MDYVLWQLAWVGADTGRTSPFMNEHIGLGSASQDKQFHRRQFLRAEGYDTDEAHECSELPVSAETLRSLGRLKQHRTS